VELPDVLELPAPGARLRALREDDWPLDQALSRVPDVPRWTYYPADIDAQVARERVSRSLVLRADGRGGRLVVELDGASVGAVGLVERVDGPYVHYALLPAGRGRGLATLAVRAVARWALVHGAGEVRARTMVDNAASERVLERASFERCGRDVDPLGVAVVCWVRRPEANPTHE
jgi:RimJ/RimL family protein N-acetyltransferase